MEQFYDFNLEEELKIRGRKVHGNINLAQRPDGTWISLPILMVIGKEDGPIVLADACIHGDEQEGTEGVIRAYETLNPEIMKGTYIGVPVVNMDSFNLLSRYGVTDFVPQDLNRIFPGDEKGYMTLYLCHYYYENIVRKADAVITIHGGGNYLYLEPVSIYIAGESKASKLGKEIAESFGYKAIWVDYSISNGETRGDEDRIAYYEDIPVVTVEIGGQCTRIYQREEDVQSLCDGICNTLRVMGVMDDKPVEKPDDLYYVAVEYIYGKQGGLNTPLKKGGEMVKEGECITEVKNVFGEVVDRVYAPYDAVVIGYWSYAVVQPRSWVYMLGKLLDDVK